MEYKKTELFPARRGSVKDFQRSRFSVDDTSSDVPKTFNTDTSLLVALIDSLEETQSESASPIEKELLYKKVKELLKKLSQEKTVLRKEYYDGLVREVYENSARVEIARNNGTIRRDLFPYSVFKNGIPQAGDAIRYAAIQYDNGEYGGEIEIKGPAKLSMDNVSNLESLMDSLWKRLNKK